MTSKNLFFNLLKENLLRRIWTLALTCTFFFLYFPIVSLATSDLFLRGLENADAIVIDRAKYQLYQQFTEQHGEGFIVITVIVFSVLMALNAFSYLHDQKRTDFYHSLPINRATLFSVNVINSFLIFSVPYLLMALISGLIIGRNSGFEGCIGFALQNSLIGICYYLLLFSVSSLAMLMTGTKAVGFLGTLVFFFYGPLTYEIVITLMQTFFHTFYYQYDAVERIMRVLSPVFWMVNAPEQKQFLCAVIALVVSFGFGCLGLMLYRIRKSEMAGNAMAFRKTEAPIRILITIPIGLGVGSIFGSALNNSDVWFIFGIIFAVVIAHSVIDVIMNQDFRKLFAHKLQMLFCLAAALAIFCVFRFDLFGYDRYVPNLSRIESAGVFNHSLSGIYGNEDYIKIEQQGSDYYMAYGEERTERMIVDEMQLKDLDTVKKIAEEGIAAVSSSNPSQAYDDSDGRIIRQTLIGWHEPNGKTIYRTYPIDMKAISNELRSIHRDPVYKETVYPVLSRSEEEVADIVGVNYRDAFGAHHITFNGDSGDALKHDIQKLWSTYCSELRELTIDERMASASVVGLQFKSSDFQNKADLVRSTNGYIGEFNNVGYYPVYPSFAKTLALLKEYGVEVNKDLTVNTVSQIILTDYRSTRDEAGTIQLVKKPDLAVTDPEQIRELLSCCEPETNLIDEIHPTFYDIDATAYIANVSASQLNNEKDAMEPEASGVSLVADIEESYHSVRLNMNARNIPQFVKDYFGITEEELQKNIEATTW